MVMHILISCVNVHTGSRDNLTVKKSMNKTMTNAVAQSICLILLWSLAKGTELNHFSIMDLECIDGNVSVSMICSVPKPQNMIIIFKDGTELTRCTTYSAPPYMHCTNSTLKDVIASSTVMNYSMIFQIESAKTDFLIGKWVCQNGGPNDPSWSLSFPNITCPPQSHCAPKSNFADDVVEEQHDVAICIVLMLVPGVTALVCLMYKTIHDGSHNVIRAIIVIGFILFFLLSILVIALNMNNGAKIGLTVVCCLIVIGLDLLIVIPVIRT